MKQNNKIIILGILVVVVVITWMPKGTKPAAVLADNSEVDDSAQNSPVTTAVSVKRCEFADWGRDPFAFSRTEKPVDTSHLLLRAIMFKTENPSAFINDSAVVVGDKIAGKTVKQIDENRVVLTDQTMDYVLELHKGW